MTRRRRPWRRRLAVAAWGLALVPALALGAVAGEPARFVAGLEDLPLMPGLDAMRGAGVWFDTPQGRIVQAYATGPVTRGAIEAFYAETLPQLGWREVAAGVWSRDGEALRLEIVEPPATRGQAPIVRFALSPE